MTFPNGKVGAPLIVDDLAIIHVVTANWGREGAARDRLYAFDKRSGQLVWSSTPGTQPQDNSWTIPWVAPQADGRVLLYVSTGCGHLAAVDAHTGDPVFRAPMAKGGVVVNPVLSGNLLIASHAMENLDSTKTGGMFAFDVTSPLLPAGEEGAPVLPMPMSSGHFFDLKVDRAGATVVSDITLDGQPLGAPSIAWGRVLVHTTKHLYAFGNNDPITAWKPVLPAAAQAGPPARLRVRPAEVILRPGESAAITVDVLDAQGRFIRNTAPASVNAWIPPTAKVKSEMKAVWKDGRLTAPLDAGLTAGAFQVKVGDLVGTFRGRTVSGVPYAQDFEGFAVTETDPVHPDQKFAWPPLPWIGARFKWDVRERDGSKVLAKTLDKVLFQRALTFVGHPDERDYTMQVDLMSDGDSRQMSAVGVIHQRYIIAVKGNQRNIEVSSNQERLKRSVPFEMLPGVWYRMVTRVSVNADGVAHIQAKVWPRAEPEPTAWTLDIEHAEGHPQGAPGLFGFTPRNLHPVFVDNLVITPNTGAAR